MLGRKPLETNLYEIQDIQSKKMKEHHIIGVVKDFNFKSVHVAIEPLVIRTGIPGDVLVLRSPAGGRHAGRPGPPEPRGRAPAARISAFCQPSRG